MKLNCIGLVLLLIMPVIIPIGIDVLINKSINKKYHIEYSNVPSVPKGKFRIGKEWDNEEQIKKTLLEL